MRKILQKQYFYNKKCGLHTVRFRVSKRRMTIAETWLHVRTFDRLMNCGLQVTQIFKALPGFYCERKYKLTVYMYGILLKRLRKISRRINLYV